eukprot:2051442-Rhodomonas_salina.1
MLGKHARALDAKSREQEGGQVAHRERGEPAEGPLEVFELGALVEPELVQRAPPDAVRHPPLQPRARVPAPHTPPLPQPRRSPAL